MLPLSNYFLYIFLSTFCCTFLDITAYCEISMRIWCRTWRLHINTWFMEDHLYLIRDVYWKIQSSCLRDPRTYITGWWVTYCTTIFILSFLKVDLKIHFSPQGLCTLKRQVCLKINWFGFPQGNWISCSAHTVYMSIHFILASIWMVIF